MHDGKPSRPWRLIAQELSVEGDHNKVTQLAEELTRALDEQLSRPNSSTQNGRVSLPPMPPSKARSA
jgi:hypothetical protein